MLSSCVTGHVTLQRTEASALEKTLRWVNVEIVVVELVGSPLFWPPKAAAGRVRLVCRIQSIAGNKGGPGPRLLPESGRLMQAMQG